MLVVRVLTFSGFRLLPRQAAERSHRHRIGWETGGFSCPRRKGKRVQWLVVEDQEGLLQGVLM